MTPIKRVNYFTGQLLGAADFQAEQDYYRAKQRLHNRTLHGLGVVEGLNVSVGKGDNAGSIVVTPGSALDPTGELIILCEASLLPLKSTAAAVLVHVRYTERPGDEVPVVTTNPDEAPQPSRIEEGCELVLVDEAPPTTTKARRALASNPTSVALARLVRTRTGWRVDRKFKVARV
jgi:hypothetical protein